MGSPMSYMPVALSVAALSFACSRPADRADRPAADPPPGSPAPRAAKDEADAMPEHRKTPEPPRTFVDGPPIDPPGKLLEWLETTASAEPRPRIRLPVVVQFSNAHRIGLAGGFIGVSPAIPPGSIAISLDDTAMGISLLDRVRDACPDDRQTACAVWLEGRWGGGADRKFRVFRLVGLNPPPPPAGGAAIRALIEQDAARP